MSFSSTALAPTGNVALPPDLSNYTVAAPSWTPGGTPARPLIAKFNDIVNLNDAHLARDGVTDDTAKFTAAVTEAMRRKATLVDIGGGGPILLATYQQTVANFTFKGASVRDEGQGGTYGSGVGTELLFTNPYGSPFLLESAMSMEGVNIYYPLQTEAAAVANSGNPTVYAPLFKQTVPTGSPASSQQINSFRMKDCIVLNSYITFSATDLGAGSVIGALDIDGCWICSLYRDFEIANMPEISRFRGSQFSTAAWGNSAIVGGPTYNLRNFRAANGRWISVVGDGTSTAAPSRLVQGIKSVDCYVLGEKGVVADGGGLDISEFIGGGFDASAGVVQILSGGSITNTTFVGGVWFPASEPAGTDVTAISITDPNPNKADNITFIGTQIPQSAGSIGTITGTNVGAISFIGVKAPYEGTTPGGTGPIHGIYVNAPYGKIRVDACDFRIIGEDPSPYLATAVDLNCLIAQVNGNYFSGCGTAIAIRNSACYGNISGNTADLTASAAATIGCAAATGMVGYANNNFDKPELITASAAPFVHVWAAPANNAAYACPAKNVDIIILIQGGTGTGLQITAPPTPYNGQNVSIAFDSANYTGTFVQGPNDSGVGDGAFAGPGGVAYGENVWKFLSAAGSAWLRRY